MSSRKRDSLGRFSVGNDSFARESTTFKRPRGVNPSLPSYPGSVGAFNPAGQAPPQAGSLAAGYSSGIVDIASNSTSSLPVQARPWGPECAVGDWAPGALLFVRKDQNLTSFKSVADLPTANWLLREARTNLGFLSSTLALDDNMGAASNDHPTAGWLGNSGWNFFGPLRNAQKSGPASLITLCNVDVFGRSKVGNLWGQRIRNGMRVGLALVPMDIPKYGGAMYGPGTRSRVMDTYVQGLVPDNAVFAVNSGVANFADASAMDRAKNASATMTADDLIQSPSNGTAWVESSVSGANSSYTVWQWMPTLDGVLCEHVLKYFDGNVPDFIDHISLGCISNCLQAGRTTIPGCLKALVDTDTYTLLPQIEILME